jgi:hypothetical protein
MARDHYRKKILTVEPGTRVAVVARLLVAIEDIDEDIRRNCDEKPVVRATAAGVSVFAANHWRP